MTDLPHLRLHDASTSIQYTYAGGGGGGEFRVPPRDRVPHAQKLRGELEDAVRTFDEQKQTAVREPTGLTLTLCSEIGYPLKLESLDRPGSDIELLSVGEENGAVVANIFVPYSRMEVFLRLLDSYERKDTKTGKPRNQALIESIASARLAVAEDFWRDSIPFPEANQTLMWEVWLRSADGAHEAVHRQFVDDCESAGLRPNRHYIRFPDRVVSLAFGTSQQISQSLGLLTTIAELRKAKELASTYMGLPSRFQREYVDDFLTRVTFAGADSPAVCLLDTGVNSGHPLLAPALADTDMHAADTDWGTADHHPQQHGTGMAGIALYGSLTDVLASNNPLTLHHRLESAKILPPPPRSNEPEVYGYVTEAAVSRAIIAKPNRNRVLCMAVTTDDRDAGVPSSWSGTLDQMCSGVNDEVPKLMFVSAGNVDALRDVNEEYTYPDTNLNDAGVEDPAQAWNVVTVGAYTEKIFITDQTFDGWEPIAGAGDLCPASRTSLAWGDDQYSGWPMKPDIVVEGGNYATDGRNRDTPEDLALLTTKLGDDGQLFQCVGDTSPATADAARLAARLWSVYPGFWPETVRALVIHSANWTDPMISRFPGPLKAEVHKRIRCYGFGVPDLRRAQYSAENAVTIIFEGEIQPFRMEAGTAKTKEMHIHRLPWPVDVLQGLGEVDVSMRVTLSYFVEPSPGRRGWTTSTSHRYQSHGLRFDVIRPTEDEPAFLKRLTRAAWDDPKIRPNGAVEETRNWMVGADGRTNGSVHSDWWTGLATELAACDRIAVYPVTGWWKERAHKGRVASKTRYSLVVSVSTPEQNVDLYAAIANQVEIASVIETL